MIRSFFSVAFIACGIKTCILVFFFFLVLTIEVIKLSSPEKTAFNLAVQP